MYHTMNITTCSRLMLVAGLLVGLSLGGGATYGTLASLGYFNESVAQLTEQQLHAMATHGGDLMAIATGPIDQDVEGIFILDYVTGDLTCQVVNARFGTLAGVFKQNVVQDLGVQAGKQPKYLLATGRFEPRQNVSNVRPANSVVYVADSNTGNYVAYMLPWNQQLANAGGAQAAAMVAVGRGSARNAVVE
jgi:hypothetical protein